MEKISIISRILIKNEYKLKINFYNLMFLVFGIFLRIFKKNDSFK